MVSLDKVLSSAEQSASAEPALWHHAQTDEVLLKRLIEDHHKWTGSLRARHIMDHWVTSRAKFVKVFPNEYRRALSEQVAKAGAAKAIADAGGSPAAALPDTAVNAKTRIATATTTTTTTTTTSKPKPNTRTVPAK